MTGEEPETAYCPDCGQVVEVEGHFDRETDTGTETEEEGR